MKKLLLCSYLFFIILYHTVITNYFYLHSVKNFRNKYKFNVSDNA